VSVTTLGGPVRVDTSVPAPLPTITIRPPWSWCTAEATGLTTLGVPPKLVENRGRAVSPAWIGADWAIHAGKQWDAAGAADPRVRRAWEAWMGCPLETQPIDWVMPTGAVVAVARLAGCHRAVHDDRGDACCPPWGEPWWETGIKGLESAWHLEWADVRKLRRPVQARGQQAVPWWLPPDVAARVAAQLNDRSGQ
jgi:hypothetical protein